MLELIKILKDKAIAAGNKCNADMYTYFRGKIDALSELESLFELESIKQTRDVSKAICNNLYGVCVNPFNDDFDDYDFKKFSEPPVGCTLRCTVRYRISFDRDVMDEELHEVIDNIIESHGFNALCDDYSVYIKAITPRVAVVYIDVPKGCGPF